MTNYANISNLSVSNWVYGNITSAEYYIRLFKFITTHNVTTCPADAPFVLVNSTSCSPCVSPTPLYDANLAVCVSGCPTGTTLDISQRSCLSSLCPYPGQIQNATTKACTCAPATPYFTGSACISCFAPSYWNSSTKSCNTCDMSRQFYFAPDRGTCVQCPITSPISFGLGCGNCNQTSYYDATLAKCIACPNNRLYNPVSQKC